MNICFLEGDMSRSGGTERMTAWLSGKLCAEHKVSVLSLRFSAGKFFFPMNDGVTHRVVPASGGKLGIVKQIRWIHQYLLRNRIECVINVDVGMALYGIPAAKGTGAKVITWEHGNYYNNWGSKAFPMIRKLAARRSGAMVVLTRRDKENYAKNISRCTDVWVIPNPVESIPHSYDTDSRTILSVGHLLENKGYHRAIEVAAKVLPSRPEWKWIIRGEGPERSRLEALIRDAGLEGRILLPGLSNEIDSIYSSAAFLVMTSQMEGLPMVLLEGKAHGLPLVAFDIMTGPSDIIDDGINGYLIDPFDTTAMAEKVGMLMDSGALRTEMSNRSGVGMERFLESAILEAWNNLLRSEL